MRNILDIEKKIVDHLVDARKNNKYEKMQFAYILRKFVAYDYICLDNKDMKSSITTFLQGCKKESQEVFYKIVDIIGLFEELKAKGYIIITKNNQSTYEYPRYHYDKNKITEHKQLGLVRIEGNGVLNNLELKGNEKNRYYGEIVNTIEDYLDSIIYPLQSLTDYKENSYKTIEQRRHNCAITVGVCAIIFSFIIGIGSPFLSKYISYKSDKESLEQLSSAIKEQKSISIDKFPEIIPDTLNVKVTEVPNKLPINLNVTLKDNPPANIK